MFARARGCSRGYPLLSAGRFNPLQDRGGVDPLRRRSRLLHPLRSARGRRNPLFGARRRRDPLLGGGSGRCSWLLARGGRGTAAAGAIGEAPINGEDTLTQVREVREQALGEVERPWRVVRAAHALLFELQTR